MKQKIKNTLYTLSYSVVILFATMSFVSCINPGVFQYPIKGEHCKDTQPGGALCSFATRGFNIDIQARGDRYNSLGITVRLNYFRADCQIKYNYKAVEADIDSLTMHPTYCYLDDINLKSDQTIPLSAGRVPTLRIEFGKLPIYYPTVVKISLGAVSIGDTASIDLGSVEVDLTKHTIAPGK